MKTFIALSLVAAICGQPASSSVIFSGGFDESDFSTKYDVLKRGSPFAVTVGGDVATIKKPLTPGGATGNTFIIPRIKVIGNFRQDVTVDFSGVSNYQQSVTIFVSVSVNFNEGFENSSQFATFVDSNAVAQARHNYISDGVATPAFAYPSASDGKITLRLERRGDELTSFYRDGSGSFVAIDRISAVTFSQPASFYMSLNAYAPTAFAGSVGFQDFSISTVPEPASWALLICGFGIIGVTMRRRTAVRSW